MSVPFFVTKALILNIIHDGWQSNHHGKPRKFDTEEEDFPQEAENAIFDPPSQWLR